MLRLRTTEGITRGMRQERNSEPYEAEPQEGLEEFVPERDSTDLELALISMRVALWLPGTGLALLVCAWWLGIATFEHGAAQSVPYAVCSVALLWAWFDAARLRPRALYESGTDARSYTAHSVFNRSVALSYIGGVTVGATQMF